MQPGTQNSSYLRRLRMLRLTFYSSVGAATLGWAVVAVAGTWVDACLGASGGRKTRQFVQNPHVVVVKSTRTLYLFDGDSLVRRFPVSLGPYPVGQKECAGDGRTPEGRFYVCTKNVHSPYHRFVGISYPDAAAADRGVRAGLISDGEARAIRRAVREGRCPSWTTALGGGIGLHGSTPGASRTAGCVALADAHVDELFDVLRVGDAVEILP